MKLIDYIKEAHNGNVSEFARSQGVKPNQATRWLLRGCEWHNGAVWCKITKQVNSNGKARNDNLQAT